MDDAAIVRRLEAASCLKRPPDGPPRRERTGAQAIGERSAFDEFGDDVLGAVVGADVEDRDDVRMVERAGGARFLAEPLKPFGVFRVGCREHLYGHVAVEAAVARPVDLAHRTSADQHLDLVGADERSRGQGHS